MDSFLELMSSSGTVGGFVLYGSMVLPTSVMLYVRFICLMYTVDLGCFCICDIGSCR